MPIVTVLPGNKTLQVATGTTLLAALASAGSPLKTKCTDSECSTQCHVYVPEGKKSLSKLQRAENDKLEEVVGVTSKSRLACQARVGDEDVTVELPAL